MCAMVCRNRCLTMRGGTPVINEGETTVQFLGLSSDVFATWSVWAIVDTGDLVMESNESDNKYGPEVVDWHGPNLEILSVLADDTTPNTSLSITITVTFKNTGDRPTATGFDLELFYNSGAPPTPGASGNDTKSYGVLDA